MGDMLERFVQSSAQQASAPGASEQTATSDRNGSSQSGGEVAANGGANSGAPTSILPGTIPCVYDTHRCDRNISTNANAEVNVYSVAIMTASLPD